MKDLDVHPKRHHTDIAYPPFREELRQEFGKDKRSLKLIVELTHIIARQLHGPMCAAFAKKADAATQVRFREMRMIKTNDRNFQGAADRDRFPPNLIRVAGFEDVRPLTLYNFLDGTHVHEGAVARGA